MSVPVALIAAVAENGVIGSEGDIPWRLPSDFAHFRRMTLGKPVIMGRKTFESLGKPLPGRTNIVVTRSGLDGPEGVVVVSDLATAFEEAQRVALETGTGELMVAGGGEIYRASIDLADRLYISHVAVSPQGDARFPEISPELWEMTGEMDVPKSVRDSAEYVVKVYERRGGSAR